MMRLRDFDKIGPCEWKRGDGAMYINMENKENIRTEFVNIREVMSDNKLLIRKEDGKTKIVDDFTIIDEKVLRNAIPSPLYKAVLKCVLMNKYQELFYI